MPFAAAANWPAACSCSIAAAAGLGAVAAFRACVCAWDDECFLPHGSCQFGDILLSRVTAPCRLEVQKEHTERHGDLANWMPGAGYQMRLNSTSVSVGKQSMAMRLYDSLGIDAPSLTGSESWSGMLPINSSLIKSSNPMLRVQFTVLLAALTSLLTGPVPTYSGKIGSVGCVICLG